MNAKKELISKLDLQNVNENSTQNEITNAIKIKIANNHKLLELETENNNQLKEQIVYLEIAKSGFLDSENPKQIIVSEFKKEYCETIHTDTNGKRFVKIPVDNYVELNAMRNNIINAIDLISQAHEYNVQDESLSYTIYTLTNILKATSLNYESEGLDKLIAV